MRPHWLIIDGYNLLHAADHLADLLRTDMQLARHRLIRTIEHTAHRMARQTTIVFDGRTAGQDPSLTAKHLEVFFAPEHLSADTVIERLAAKYAHPERILVVTSDRAEADTVLSTGAQVMSSQEFIDQCRIDAGKTCWTGRRPGKEPKLGDLFPDGL
jgi:predicted RNA-binding protein with PIN domain